MQRWSIYSMHSNNFCLHSLGKKNLLKLIPFRVGICSGLTQRSFLSLCAFTVLDKYLSNIQAAGLLWKIKVMERGGEGKKLNQSRALNWMNFKEKHPSASERHIPASRDCHLLGNSFRGRAKRMLHLSHKFPRLVLHLRVCQRQMALIAQLPVKLKKEHLQEDAWALLGFFLRF